MGNKLDNLGSLVICSLLWRNQVEKFAQQRPKVSKFLWPWVIFLITITNVGKKLQQWVLQRARCSKFGDLEWKSASYKDLRVQNLGVVSHVFMITLQTQTNPYGRITYWGHYQKIITKNAWLVEQIKCALYAYEKLWIRFLFILFCI